MFIATEYIFAIFFKNLSADQFSTTKILTVIEQTKKKRKKRGGRKKKEYLGKKSVVKNYKQQLFGAIRNIITSSSLDDCASVVEGSPFPPNISINSIESFCRKKRKKKYA